MKEVAIDFRATPHRRNLSGIVENMIRFTYE